ncbi:MAG: hypothetical protein Kow0068_08260 [Marinilabiliales bacterium]
MIARIWDNVINFVIKKIMPGQNLSEEKLKQEKLEKKIKRWGMIIFIIIALGFAINAYYAYVYVPNKAKASMQKLHNTEQKTNNK